MIIRELVVGPIAANCFILGCENTKKAVVIDPGDEADRILLECSKYGLTIVSIVNTHGHIDHVGANAKLKAATKADLLIHAADAPWLEHLKEQGAAWGMKVENSPPPDRTIDDGDEIVFGEETLKVLTTPGHSLGSVSLVSGDMAWVGDTLFAGSIGRSDLPGGNHAQLIESVRTKLFPLGDDVKAFPGHGPATTMGQEKKYNPFFQ